MPGMILTAKEAAILPLASVKVGYWSLLIVRIGKRISASASL